MFETTTSKRPTGPSWTRRRAVSSLAGVALATANLVTPSARAGARDSSVSAAFPEIPQMTTNRATFVLVHGGWHGGWCWNRVAPLLRAAGHDVWTPTLTGLADRAHALRMETDLETHVRDIVGLLEFEELERVILVGHSYAGMVITGAAAEAGERISQLIYLDAFVPRKGDTLTKLLSPEREYYYRLQAVQRGQGWRVPPPPVAALGVSAPTDVGWLEARLTDQPLRSFDQALSAEPPATLTRTYIHCTEGPIVRSFAPFASSAQTSPEWGSFELATGHDAMITQPRALTDLLLGVANAHARPCDAPMKEMRQNEARLFRADFWP